MRAALVMMMLLLAGCAARPEVRAPAAIEVDKLVTVRCVKEAPARPAYATEALASSATDVQYGDALAVDWAMSRGYERALEAAVRACIQ